MAVSVRGRYALMVIVLACSLAAGCGKPPILAIAADDALAPFASLLADKGFTRLPVEDDAAALYQLDGGACQAALIHGEDPGARYEAVDRITSRLAYAVSTRGDIGGWGTGVIAIGALKDSVDARQLESILAAFYIDINTADIRYIESEFLRDAFARGDIESALFFALPNDAEALRIIGQGALCPIPAAVAEPLKERYGYIEPYTLPAGSAGSKYDLDTVAVLATLIVKKDADEAMIERLRKAVSGYSVLSGETDGAEAEGEADASDTPDTPDTPDTSNTPDTPDTPDTLDILDTQDTSDTPGTSNAPDTSPIPSPETGGETASPDNVPDPEAT